MGICTTVVLVMLRLHNRLLSVLVDFATLHLTGCHRCPTASQTAVERDDFGSLNISYFSTSGVNDFYVSGTLETNGVSAENIVIGVATEAVEGDPSGGIVGIGFPQDEASILNS